MTPQQGGTLITDFGFPLAALIAVIGAFLSGRVVPRSLYDERIRIEVDLRKAAEARAEKSEAQSIRLLEQQSVLVERLATGRRRSS